MHIANRINMLLRRYMDSNCAISNEKYRYMQVDKTANDHNVVYVFILTLYV